jgi:hypothetical protein
VPTPLISAELPRAREVAKLAIASFIIHYPHEEATPRDDEAVQIGEHVGDNRNSGT